MQSMTSSPSGDDHLRHSADGSDMDVSTTLYVGNLHPYTQQRSLEDLCGYFGAVETVKVIKDRASGTGAGYAFVKFDSKASAERALQALNGKDYLGKPLNVNWALPNNHREDTTHHCHLFVGDLGNDVTDAVLFNSFCSAVGQCSDARVMWDHTTGRSKGYGFVSFRTKEDANTAIEKMQGTQIGSRRIRLGWAQHKQDESALPPDFDEVDRADPYNANVYIGNVGPGTSEADLMAHFSAYGPVSEVKLHKKGGFGFVKYEMHESAVKAIVGQHGKKLHGRVLKCSWGKNMGSSQKKAAASMASSLITALQGTYLSAVQPQIPSLSTAGSQNAMASFAAAAAAANAAAEMHRVKSKELGNYISNQQASAPAMYGLPQAPVIGCYGAPQPMTLNNSLMYSQGNLPQVGPLSTATQMMLMHGLQSQDATRLQAAMVALNSPATTAGSLVLEAPDRYSGGTYSNMYTGADANVMSQFHMLTR